MEKTKLIVTKGFGRADVDTRRFTVLRTCGLWSLGFSERGGVHWLKENVKRVSTLQKFADERGYGIEIIVNG